MQFCQTHWDELRDAIEERKLDHLVAKSGEEAAERMKAELEGTAGVSNFDPLMSAHTMIVGNALNALGPALLMGDYCPLCEIEKTAKAEGIEDLTATGWITGAADGVLTHCQKHGLMRREN